VLLIIQSRRYYRIWKYFPDFIIQNDFFKGKKRIPRCVNRKNGLSYKIYFFKDKMIFSSDLWDVQKSYKGARRNNVKVGSTYINFVGLLLPTPLRFSSCTPTIF